VVSRCLVLLALRVALDELCDSIVHLWPPEVSSYQLDRFVLAHVTSDFGNVFGRPDRVDEVFILQDPEDTLTVEQPILDLEYLFLCLSAILRHLTGAHSFRCLPIHGIGLSCLPYQNREVFVPLPSRERGELSGRTNERNNLSVGGCRACLAFFGCFLVFE
jgi:hypothetical protein